MSFLVKAAKKVVKGVVNVVKGVVKAVVDVVSSVVNFVTQPFMAQGPGTDPASEASRQLGVTVTKPAGGDTNIPIVYGMRQVGGNIIFYTTGSNDNKYLWVVYALSEGPIEGIYDISIDDEDITTSTLISSLNAGAITNVDKYKSRYTGKTVLQFWYGGYNANPASLSTTTSPHLLTQSPGWKNTNAMNGVACLMARFEMKKVATQEEADNNPFGGGIPNIKVTLLGRRVASLAGTGSTAGAAYESGTYSERYSTNPAEILLDYLRNPRYGKGLSNDEIDWDSFRRAANKFNQEVEYVNGVRGPILTCNYVLDTSGTLMNNTKTLLQGMRTYMPYVRGKYKLVVEDAGNPTDITSGVATVVKTFNKDTLIDNISYTGVDRSAKYTAVEVTYVSPADKWSNQTITYPTTEAERLSYKVLDGGRENKGSFTFGTITNHAMAFDMARLIFEKSRVQQTASFTAPLEAMELEPGDNIHIQGTILDFVEDDPTASIPWRIISIKLNNDYTYQIDCVRNPDDIYPHVRAGERDIILPPYIPRGASIYYPTVYTDLGLFPPGTKFWLNGQSSVGTGGGLLTPPPTNVDDGGVGGPGFVGANPDPVVKEAPPPLNDYIQVDQVTYVENGNLISATIKFRQPPHPMYAGVDFWYKRSISTEVNYLTASDTQKANAGDFVYYTINNLVKGNIPYILVSRVKYTNGDSSLFAVRTPLTVTGGITTEDPPDYEETAGPGWELPITTPENNPRNTIFSRILGNTYLTGSTRKIDITVTQDINLTGINTQVDGVNIYYKLSSAQYFEKTTVIFDSTYFWGIPYTFTPNLSLGVGNPSPDDASDNFDFIFRFVYKDGTESTKQWRYMNADVQSTFTEPFGTVFRFNEDSSSYSFQTVTQAPPGTATNPVSITIGLTQVGNALGANPAIVFRIEPPAAADRSNWFGVRVRSRIMPATGGTPPAFTVTDYFPVPQPSAGVWQITHPTGYDLDYQYVLTPVVNVAGVRTETTTSWLGRGAIHNRSTASDYPSNGNWLPRLSFNRIESNTIGTIQTTPLPTTNPKAFIQRWRIIAPNASFANNPNYSYYDLKLDVSHITDLNRVYIYRRHNVVVTGTGYSTYFGIGRWEVLSINANSSSPLDLKIRAPISYTRFNPYYGVPGRSDALLNTSGVWSTKQVLAPVIMNQSDYFVVVQTTSGISPIGVMLPRAVGNLPVEMPVANFNTTLNGYSRRLTDAIAAPADNTLLWGPSATNTYTNPGGVI